MGATPCRFESCPGHDGQLPDADVRRALARRAAPAPRARGAGGPHARAARREKGPAAVRLVPALEGLRARGHGGHPPPRQAVNAAVKRESRDPREPALSFSTARSVARAQRHALPLTGWPAHAMMRGCARSEEHTSELQSQSNIVCRLLLDKKRAVTLLGSLVAVIALPRG